MREGRREITDHYFSSPSSYPRERDRERDREREREIEGEREREAPNTLAFPSLSQISLEDVIRKDKEEKTTFIHNKCQRKSRIIWSCYYSYMG